MNPRLFWKIATGVAAAGAAGFLWIANLEILRREDRIQLEEARMELAATMVQLREAQEDLGREPTSAWMKSNPQVREAARAVGVAFFQGKTLHVLAKGLPRPPRTKEYVLWAHFGAKRLRAGAYTVDDKGCLAGKHRVSEDLKGADGFAITLEPAGGADSPTGPIYLLPN
jgi:hypothetical protein